MNTLADLPLGQQFRDEALDTHRQNHSRDIEKVRVALLAACRMGNLREITSDDASVIADQLGLPQGERRWLGAVFRNWPRVRATNRTMVSRLARRHARRLTVWEVL